MAGTMHGLDWLFAIGTLFFLLSAWSLGANDVANSYATSVSSKSLTLVQAGCLAVVTEFIGAIALGQKVTATIRKGVFDLEPFLDSPGTLILAMVIAEAGSALWLTACTRMGFPVSTTQSLVGALVGVGIALDLQVKWGWESNSVSQIAASWGIAPLIGAGFGAVIMLSIRLLVHDRKNPMKMALYVLPFYYALTAGILSLFIIMDGGHGIPTPEEMGTGKVCGIILGVFAGVWIISAVFFIPYFHAKLVKEDSRLRFWHIPMGPLLWKEGYSLYWPGSSNAPVTVDYYATDYIKDDDMSQSHTRPESSDGAPQKGPMENPAEENNARAVSDNPQTAVDEKRQKSLEAIDRLPWMHPKRLYATAKLVVTYGITRDVIHHQSKGLEEVHARAPQFDNKVEHLWTTAQVCSAMIMSISHGANDVSNAIGPFTTEYMTWKSGVTSAKTDTPTWIKAVGGLTLGVGFWTFGYFIMRNLGNRITKHSPSRGFAMELGAAITVLLASKYGLPVSTTQCITGGVVGVALVNWDLKSINWKQLGKIFLGWCLTVPCAGLVAGIIMGMAINVPQWNH
ncbi:phosphate transporter [Emericellopsis atlantica]|uniref:Phosphate transporter n=1 Tax=Emericellopsis atlantica TaxID=2614577 RepID=A0A9P7ZJT6_9HYPO|nr:phosphate transporter [Emericellopsis atlantica]KAG9252920.1 phosphate transporter [Emericellopsis atlantica]